MKHLMWLRPLLIIYSIALMAGLWEVTSVQRGYPPEHDPELDRQATARMADLFGQLYADRMVAYHMKGYHAFREHRLEEARQHFERALAIDNKDTKLLYRYAQTLVLLDEDQGEIDAAIEAWRRNFPHSRFPDPRQILSQHYVRGYQAFKQNRLQDARKHFERALAVGQLDEHLLYNYALTLVLLEEDPVQVSGAVEAWRRNFPHSHHPDPRLIREMVPASQPPARDRP